METKITLTGLAFFAYHGYYPEEQVNGGEFKVDVQFHTLAGNAILEDKIEGTVDYTVVYALVKKEMETPSRLIEHLAFRIVTSIKQCFPQITDVEVTVYKLQPPIGGASSHVSVTIKG